jgi:ribosome-associated protein
MTETNYLIQKITEGIQEKKGSQVVIADLRQTDSTVCDYFVICQGNSPTQVAAIAQSVGEYVRKEADARPLAVSGLHNAQWVAMDYNDVLVHIFLPETRAFYDIEHLWEDANLTAIPDID